MKKIIYLFLFLTSLVFGAAYQIPNNSINSNSLATAYVANANGADAAYFNPANMVYNQDINEIEAVLAYVYLPQMTYSPTAGTTPIQTKEQKTFIPSLHYVSPKLSDNGIRIGFSIAVPYGLTREWTDQPAMASAKKFSLETVEFNPSIAFPITEQLSFAFGVRYMIASGHVQIDTGAVTVDMKGDDDSFGYNLALSYKVSKELTLAATYRSDIAINLTGSADITGIGVPKSDASTKVVIPDNLILAAAYTFHQQTTVEVTYDKTYWSRVTETNFDYANSTAEALLGTTKPKLWHNTVAYRIGLTHKLQDLTLMSGIAYSTNAANEEYVGYSSPEADSITYAFGGRYNLSQNLEVGLSLLYADYKDRTSNQVSASGVKGTFSGKSAYVLATGISYKF